MEDRVRELRVHVRTDVAEAAAIGPAAERCVRAALERCAARLEQQAPGRIILVQRLPLRWQVDEDALDDPTSLDDLAQAAADSITRIASPAVALDRLTNDDAIVVFEDEAHWWGSYLVGLARGKPAWFHAAIAEEAHGDPLMALAEPHRRSLAQSALRRLARENLLAEVLAAHPASTVVSFGAALEGNGSDPTDGGPVSSANAFPPAAAIDAPAQLASLVALSASWPEVAPAVRLLTLRLQAAVLLELEPDAPRTLALAAAAFEQSVLLPLSLADRPVTAGGSATPDRPPGIERGGFEEPAAESAPSKAAWVTRGAGLFLLLARIQELDLAETLWRACLPEGAVLAAAAAALLGPAFVADPAAQLLGGVETATPCPVVTPEQHAEIATATCAALAEALPRRGLAEIPPASVMLVERPVGRMLVAAAEGSPFAFFAWPAATAEQLKAGLRALLDTWPHRAELAAAPPLIALDSSGRLRPSREPVPRVPLVPEAASAPAAALLALVVGAPCLLFSARARVPTSTTAEAFVTRYLARFARIRLSPEQMQVILTPAGADLDLDLRRAGLDRDPGWLPWLKRTVRFEFAEVDDPSNGRTVAAAPNGSA